MELIFSVRALLPQNCYMASIDLRDAYLQIPIAEAFQKFLRLAVRVGEYTIHLQFQALPFALSSLPQIFTKVMAEAMDNLPLFAASPEQLTWDLELTRLFEGPRVVLEPQSPAGCPPSASPTCGICCTPHNRGCSCLRKKYRKWTT